MPKVSTTSGAFIPASCGTNPDFLAEKHGSDALRPITARGTGVTLEDELDLESMVTPRGIAQGDQPSSFGSTKLSLRVQRLQSSGQISPLLFRGLYHVIH